MSQTLLETIAGIDNTTKNYTVYEAPDGVIVGAYILTEALEGKIGAVPEAVEFDVSEDEDSGLTIEHSNETKNYHTYESEKIVTGFRISKDELPEEPPEALGLLMRKGDEDELEEALDAAAEDEEEEPDEDADELFA